MTGKKTEAPDLLALDFDGVICDGLKEYFHTAWRVHRKIWPVDGEEAPPDMIERFYRLRSVIESGWEMPLLARALQRNFSEVAILSDWGGISQELLLQAGMTSSSVAPLLDAERDEQIRTGEKAWLDLHRFYPGVEERLRSVLDSSTVLRIVTTKEERYVRLLLECRGLFLPADGIVGRGLRRPKHASLRRYRQEWGSDAEIWFVEDRLLTLQTIRRQDDLEDIRLFLAVWGYNTPLERELAVSRGGIEQLTLERFCGPFSDW